MDKVLMIEEEDNMVYLIILAVFSVMTLGLSFLDKNGKAKNIQANNR